MARTRKTTALVLALALLFTSCAEAAYQTLQYGSKGTAVKQMQTALKQLGYYSSTLDGKFGSGTQTAVKNFQKANKLTADGKAGNQTLTLLYSLANGTSSTTGGTASGSTTTASGNLTSVASTTTLRKGSKGNAVKTLQNQLKTLGYYTKTVDGDYGNGTVTAVKAFQKASKLSQDGVAGKTTMTAIANAVAKKQGTNASAQETGTATLKTGMKSSAVGVLQAQLKALGYYTSSIDNSYGNGTATAVKKFQSANGLTATGTADAATQTLLQERYNAWVNSSSTTPETSAPVTTDPNVLKAGMKTSAVGTLQTQLKALGYYTSTVDNDYGSGTTAAVKKFQSANGLTANGIADSATQALLHSQYEAYVASSSVETTAPINGKIIGNTVTAGTKANAGAVTSTLRYGSSGAAVKAVQQRLKDLGYFNGDVDGYYEGKTQYCVTAFQLQNGLATDGKCGTATWAIMSSANAVKASNAAGNTSTTFKADNGARVSLQHWYNTVKGKLSNGSTLLVYDPATGLSWKLRVISRGHHCDAEPLSAADTAAMNKAFGGTSTWTPKAVYVQLPDTTWTVASTHNTAHESGGNTSNNFDGHLCVHFLRDMGETVANDPKYAVCNQNTIRIAWKEKTGETVR